MIAFIFFYLFASFIACIILMWFLFEWNYNHVIDSPPLHTCPKKFVDDVLTKKIPFNAKKENYELRLRVGLLDFREADQYAMASFFQKLYYSLESPQRKLIVTTIVKELLRTKKISSVDIEEITNLLPPDSECQEFMDAILKVASLVLLR